MRNSLYLFDSAEDAGLYTVLDQTWSIDDKCSLYHYYSEVMGRTKSSKYPSNFFQRCFLSLQVVLITLKFPFSDPFGFN